MPSGFPGTEIGRCEHAVRVKGSSDAYEVGVSRRRDGRPGYVLLFDQWTYDEAGSALATAVGPNASRLKREYATVVARKQAIASGFTVQEQRQIDGSIRLRLTR